MLLCVNCIRALLQSSAASCDFKQVDDADLSLLHFYILVYLKIHSGGGLRGLRCSVCLILGPLSKRTAQMFASSMFVLLVKSLTAFLAIEIDL